MKSKSMYLAGLTGIGILTTLAGACGDSSGTGTGGTGTTGTTTTTTKSATTGKGVTVATSGTGGMGDGNDTFAQAAALTLGTPIDAAIDVPGTDADFYKFTGTAGPLIISADALPANTQNDQTYVDMFIELYDSNKMLIATNDDRYPHPPGNTDSEVATILPANGDYYIKVMDFCSSPLTDPMQCDATKLAALTNTGYTIFANAMVPAAGSVAEGAEPNDTEANATTVTHAATTTAGSYYLSTTWGTFTSGADVDWYKINIPANTTHDAGANTTTTIYAPWGRSDLGNGSANEIGLVEVVDPADPTKAVAAFDFKNEPRTAGRTDITLPLPASDSAFYFLKVHHGADVTPGAGSFYFLFQGVGGDNPLEKNELTNNLAVTPEVLSLLPQQTAYFVAGNLPAGDADYFKVAAISGKPKLFVACGGARNGSGLVGLTATVYKADGTTLIPNGTATESSTVDLTIPGPTAMTALDLGGEANPVIKLNATGQAAGITGTYYRCGFAFSAM